MVSSTRGREPLACCTQVVVEVAVVENINCLDVHIDVLLRVAHVPAELSAVTLAFGQLTCLVRNITCDGCLDIVIKGRILRESVDAVRGCVTL